MSGRTFRERLDQRRAAIRAEISKRAEEAARVRGYETVEDLTEAARGDPEMVQELRRELLGVSGEDAALMREWKDRREAAYRSARETSKRLGDDGRLLSPDAKRDLLARVDEAAFHPDPAGAGSRAVLDHVAASDPERFADLAIAGKISDEEFSGTLTGEVPVSQRSAADVPPDRPLEEMDLGELESLLDAQTDEGARR